MGMKQVIDVDVDVDGNRTQDIHTPSQMYRKDCFISFYAKFAEINGGVQSYGVQYKEYTLIFRSITISS